VGSATTLDLVAKARVRSRGGASAPKSIIPWVLRTENNLLLCDCEYSLVGEGPPFFEFICVVYVLCGLVFVA
jgi:hypothetical protein